MRIKEACMIRHTLTAIALQTIAAATILCAPAEAIAQPILTTKTIPIYDRPKPTTTQPNPHIAALIRALSDPSPTKRESAQQSLLKLGPQIEPQLQWALNAEEEAVAANDKQHPTIHQTYMRGFGVQRFTPDHVLPRYADHTLSVLIHHLDESRHASPSLITLRYTDAPLQTILRDFGKQLDTSISMGVQSGYRIPSESELDWVTARITINVDRANYWSTLQTILQALPSLAPGNIDEQFLQIGFDRIYLAPSLNKRDPAFNPQTSTIAGPMQIAASLTNSGPTTLTLRAAAEPSLTGLNSNATVHIDAITDDLGHSLILNDKRTFTPANNQYIPSDGYRTWQIQIPLKPLEPGRHIATIRGQFGIGTAPPQQSIAVPLPIAPSPLPEAVFITEDCRILALPGGDDSPYSTDKNTCHRETARNTRQANARIEEHSLILTNFRATPVTFVVSQWLFGGVIDSVPEPDQVAADTAVFRVNANSGEIVHLHIGVRYDQPAKQRVPPAPNPELAVHPSHAANAGQPVNFDGWTLTIKSVTPNGSVYSVSGELSRPIDTPAGYEGIHLYLGIADQARWTIVNKDRSVTQRQDGDRLIEDLTVNSAEPGCVPATLIWDTPEATRWLTAPFEFHALNDGDP